MENYLVKKKIVSNKRNAKAILGLFAVMCFALSGMIVTDLYTEKPVQILKVDLAFLDN